MLVSIISLYYYLKQFQAFNPNYRKITIYMFAYNYNGKQCV